MEESTYGIESPGYGSLFAWNRPVDPLYEPAETYGFRRVFAEKQGSSSNTDVLSLTSASSSAIAGSHTIEVTQLAQTSSEISSAMSKRQRYADRERDDTGQRIQYQHRGQRHPYRSGLRDQFRGHRRDRERDYGLLRVAAINHKWNEWGGRTVERDHIQSV